MKKKISRHETVNTNLMKNKAKELTSTDRYATYYKDRLFRLCGSDEKTERQISELEQRVQN